MSKEIGDKIRVSCMGFMGLETWIGTIVGTTYKHYIIDFGEDTIGEQRFQIRKKNLQQIF